MTQDSFVRWEQGVNRVVQADLDEDEGSKEGGISEDAVEIVVRVNCLFDRTEETQLALMLPRERVLGEAGMTSKPREDSTIKVVYPAPTPHLRSLVPNPF